MVKYMAQTVFALSRSLFIYLHMCFYFDRMVYYGIDISLSKTISWAQLHLPWQKVNRIVVVFRYMETLFH